MKNLIKVGAMFLTFPVASAFGQTAVKKEASVLSDSELVKNASATVYMSQRHSAKFESAKYKKSSPYNLFYGSLTSKYKDINLEANAYGLRDIDSNKIEGDNPGYRPEAYLSYTLFDSSFLTTDAVVGFFPEIPTDVAYGEFAINNTVKGTFGTGLGDVTLSNYLSLAATSEKGTTYKAGEEELVAQEQEFYYDNIAKVKFEPKAAPDLAISFYARAVRNAIPKYSAIYAETALTRPETEEANNTNSDDTKGPAVLGFDRSSTDMTYDWVASFYGLVASYKITDAVSLSNETRFYTSDGFTKSVDDATRVNNRLTVSYNLF